jgi:hypothetical protein
MAILFMEGFDGYSTNTEFLEDSRISQTSSADTQYDIVTGRGGSGQAIQLEISATADFIVGLSQTTTDTFFIQFAVNISLFGTADYLLQVFSGTTTQGSLYVTASGAIQYRRGTTTVLGTSSGSLSAATWHYIELEVNVNDSTGTVLLKVDGVTEINLTSQDTRESTSDQSIDSARFFRNSTSGSTTAFDDIVIGDDSGTDATSLLGDCTIEALVPDGAGNYSQWTPSAGSNYQNVDDGTSSDGDTTYNSSSTAAQKDTFTMGNMSISSGNVYAVQVSYLARKESGGGRTMRGMIRTSSTDASGTSRYIPDGYGMRHDIFENDAGGSDWTVTSVNAMEAGYELVT